MSGEETAAGTTLNGGVKGPLSRPRPRQLPEAGLKERRLSEGADRLTGCGRRHTVVGVPNASHGSRPDADGIPHRWWDQTRHSNLQSRIRAQSGRRLSAESSVKEIYDCDAMT